MFRSLSICKNLTRAKQIEEELRNIRKEIAKLNEKDEQLSQEYGDLYYQIYDDTTGSDYTVLVDKFISDTGFDGEWPANIKFERYFHWDDIDGWNVSGSGLAIYYRDVELRLKTKQLNKENL